MIPTPVGPLVPSAATELAVSQVMPTIIIVVGLFSAVLLMRFALYAVEWVSAIVVKMRAGGSVSSSAPIVGRRYNSDD